MLLFFRREDSRDTLWHTNLHRSLASQAPSAGLRLRWSQWQRQGPWLWGCACLWIPQWLLIVFKAGVFILPTHLYPENNRGGMECFVAEKLSGQWKDFHLGFDEWNFESLMDMLSGSTWIEAAFPCVKRGMGGVCFVWAIIPASCLVQKVIDAEWYWHTKASATDLSFMMQTCFQWCAVIQKALDVRCQTTNDVASSIWSNAVREKQLSLFRES